MSSVDIQSASFLPITGRTNAWLNEMRLDIQAGDRLIKNGNTFVVRSVQHLPFFQVIIDGKIRQHLGRQKSETIVTLDGEIEGTGVYALEKSADNVPLNPRQIIDLLGYSRFFNEEELS